ncbi:prepilin-type N-terminal cleavage/methylation domain-containing protein, partial [bacterium]|nr:prepilin-type N-terminal cleavage/methylation domain-containing protein [bacterium]
MKKIKKAFTLAEVLITLGVIGVVASITLPTLIK